MKTMTLRDLFLNKLHALYDIETQLVKILPKMATAASDSKLAQGFLNHLQETKVQVKRLEKIHRMLGKSPRKTKVEAIRGLVKDGEWVMNNIDQHEARDANLVRAAQFVEHYEMAGYMGAIAWARKLGENQIAKLLYASLREEVLADKKLMAAGMLLDAKLA